MLTWLLQDQVNSTSVTADASGNLLSEVRYSAFGEIRAGESTTDYQYTGQRNEIEIGLYYYVSRFYDPALAHFISADTVVPEPGNLKSYDRYAYVNGNPIKYNDPTGYFACEDSLYGCKGSANNSFINASSVTYWKWVIWQRAKLILVKGVEHTETWSSENGTAKTITLTPRDWDLQNTSLVGMGINIIAEKGGIKESGAKKATLWYHPEGVGNYNGFTTAQGIQFRTSSTIPMQNIYHEYGHSIDNPGKWNVFTPQVEKLGNVSWVSEGRISSNALIVNWVTDPTWPRVAARQTYNNFGSTELWADAFANYMAGNVRQTREGQDMGNFVHNALNR